MILRIVLGLFGMGLVVFIHELGHFVAAKLMGIRVEVFSIGWGTRLWGFQYGGTDYRISLFPLGGYCKMQGDEALRKAWTSGADDIEREKGSFYAASPFRRIIVALAGPAFNLLFALFAFSLVWQVGFTVPTQSNRIVLESDFPLTPGRTDYPATEGGLKTGDYVVAIDSRTIATYRDIQEIVVQNPDRPMSVTVDREGRLFQLQVTPALNTSTGGGRIGVYAWVDPVIESVAKDSAAALAGLRPGDRLTAAQGTPVRHAIELAAIFNQAKATVEVDFEREGTRQTTRLVILRDEAGRPDFGVVFNSVLYESPPVGPLESLQKGAEETVQSLAATVFGLRQLFRGVDLTQAIAGPLKITYVVGDVAATGFGAGLAQGTTTLLNFLGLLSIALFFMNLLPIPALDGGHIVLFLVEALRTRPLRPKTIYRYQMVGVFLVVGLLVLSTVSDMAFLFAR